MSDDEWREKVRELLRAKANVELIRLERVSRYSRESHWHRLQSAIERVQAITKELGL